IGRDQLFEFLFDDHVLERGERDIVTEFDAYLLSHRFAYRLIERRENSAFDQKLNDVARRDAESFGKFTNRRTFRKPNRCGVAFAFADLVENAFFERSLTRHIDIAFGKTTTFVRTAF